MKLKKLQDNEITSSGSNEKSIQNKRKNQEEILQIVNKRFVTEKEERVIKKISYYITILKEFIKKEKQTRKVENKLVKQIKTNQKTIEEMNSYQDNKTQTEKERGSVKDSCDSLQNNSLTDSLYSPEHWDMK